MFNKKITIYIAFGVIIIVAVLVGFQFGKKSVTNLPILANNSSDTQTNKLATPQPSEATGTNLTNQPGNVANPSPKTTDPKSTTKPSTVATQSIPAKINSSVQNQTPSNPVKTPPTANTPAPVTVPSFPQPTTPPVTTPLGTSNAGQITITSVPATVNAGDVFDVTFSLNIIGGGVMSQVGIYYGPTSVANPNNIKQFPYSSDLLCNSVSRTGQLYCSVTSPISRTLSLSISNPGVYFMRVRALTYDGQFWSAEKSITVNVSAQAGNETIITAAANAFYKDGKIISALSANGGTLRLKFIVPPEGITVPVSMPGYAKAGADFKGCGQSVNAQPGGSAVMIITPKTGCIIKSYIYNFPAMLAGLQINP